VHHRQCLLLLSHGIEGGKILPDDEALSTPPNEEVDFYVAKMAQISLNLVFPNSTCRIDTMKTSDCVRAVL
jgi:hypothetical protein